MSGRTLVTGATGYLGSTLVASLVQAGERVTVLMNPHEPAVLPGELRPHVETAHADIADARAVDDVMRDVSHVYHLAGIASPNSRLGHRIWQTNVLGSYHVARAALRHGVHRVVHVSSTAAIGYPPNGVVADEDFDPCDSVLDNVYSATKRAGE
ncbi:NAD-dependent epimerase/dehydratase family protein, partial [Mycobacteroides abscessus]